MIQSKVNSVTHLEQQILKTVRHSELKNSTPSIETIASRLSLTTEIVQFILPFLVKHGYLIERQISPSIKGYNLTLFGHRQIKI